MTYYILVDDRGGEEAVAVHGITTDLDVVRAFCKGVDKRGFYSVVCEAPKFTALFDPFNDFQPGKDFF
jgi:hypothetical protein